jgi:glycosyltransferase involved in cell wall biosynthesis
MRIGIVHNFYRCPGGEDTVVRNVCSLLAGHGHVVIPFFRHSEDIPTMPFGRTRAFFSGIYSFSSHKAMRALLAAHPLDTMNVHNLFPLISPSVLDACRRAGVPVVMTLHNYRLSCPHGIHMIDGHVCERCRGGREYWCLLRNCEGSVPKSLGYAVRSLAARALRLYADNITIYIVFTQFHRNRLVSEGIASDRIAVIPNMAVPEHTEASHPLGDYVAFAGRVSPEKGIATLLHAARKCLDIPFRIAGSYERMTRLVTEAPENVVFLGHLAGNELKEFYRCARMLVMPSVWFETFGMSLVEAMVWRKPTVVSRIGALTEIVDEWVTGLATEPGNAEELSDTIRYLWDRPNLCRQMGQAGREKALQEYSLQKHYERLMAVCETAITVGPPTGSRRTALAAAACPGPADRIG